MNTIDRLMLFLFSIIIAIISLIMAFIPLPFLPSSIKDIIARFILESNGVSIISIILLILSLRFLFKSYNLESSTYNYIESSNEFGLVKISYDTLKLIAHTGVKKVKGVKDAIINIDVADEGIVVDVIVSFYNDVIIPEASADLQKNIKEAIEKITEKNVGKVIITVDERNNTSKRKVE